MNQLLEAYPQGMLDAFGITDLSKVENYMNSQVFLLAPLALAFFSILASAGAIAGAEERGIARLLNRTADRFEPTAVRDTPRGITVKRRSTE